jgi:site-specific DNA recombinase
MRAAIYARYSSDNQRDASIEDQVRTCKKRVEAEGWELIETYSDRAISGASTLRPGYQQMLMDARNGSFDILVAEALDRLSRDQEDIAGLYKQLTFSNVTLITLSEGEINELHVGLKGTMNALFLKDLAHKTRRGLEGRVLNGKSGGGRSYGYDVAMTHDKHGERIRGNLTINQTEASIVRQIFDEYSRGKSPRAIAIALNKAGIAGPTGKGWTHSTVIGNRKRGTGILNNQLYVGKRVWNRLSYRKDRATGKRVSRLNPPGEWIVTDVPDLRIIDDAQWAQVLDLQNFRTRETRPDIGRRPNWRDRRPKHLFSGLIKCAECGGGISLVSRVYYGCSTRRNKGTCTNQLTVRLDRLEEAVLLGLQERLLTPELTRAFVQEYTREINRLRAETTASHEGAKNRLATLHRQINNIVDAVADGKTSSALRGRLEKLESDKKDLENDLTSPAPEQVRLHPNVAELYVSKVNDLRNALNEDGTREEAAQILRGLVDEIRLHPVDEQLQIELIGDLATLLGFAEKNGTPTKKPGSYGDPGSTKWLVAGAGFVEEPTIKKHV